jgi:hypothetical protein
MYHHCEIQWCIVNVAKMKCGSCGKEIKENKTKEQDKNNLQACTENKTQP